MTETIKYVYPVNCKFFGVYAGSERVAMKSSVDGVMYFHGDHLGSTNLMTDSSGNVVRTTRYTPYGSTFATNGSRDNARKFTGQILDDQTGLYYYNARYYDPVLCRFITPDSIVQDLYDPQTLNRYAYCRNNPMNRIDPTGHDDLFLETKMTCDEYEKRQMEIYGGSTSETRKQRILQLAGIPILVSMTNWVAKINRQVFQPSNH